MLWSLEAFQWGLGYLGAAKDKGVKVAKWVQRRGGADCGNG